MKGKLILSAVVITSVIFNPVSANPDTARAQATGNLEILYKSADHQDPNSWSFYFGPSEQSAATSLVASKKRSVMQSYFLEHKIPNKQVDRGVSWLFDSSMQMYDNEVEPSEENQKIEQTDLTTPGDNFGY